MNGTFEMESADGTTVLIRHRIVSVYRESYSVTVVQEHGFRSTVIHPTKEAASKLVRDLQAWLAEGDVS